jgi:hypothetical protein
MPILKNDTRKKSAVSIKISFVNLPFWTPGWPGALLDPFVMCRGGLILTLFVSFFCLCPRAKCAFMHYLQAFLHNASSKMQFFSLPAIIFAGSLRPNAFLKKNADRASIWHVNVAEKEC